MTVKLIGAILILISCASIGFRTAAMLRREVRVMENLCALLDYMECELHFRMTPLPVLCRGAAAQTGCVLQNVFVKLAQELECQVSPDAESCMHVAISSCQTVPRQTVECLLLLGKNLGRFDIDGQIKGLEAVRVMCRSKLQILNNNKESRLRSYRTLGICAGAAIVILFI